MINYFMEVCLNSYIDKSLIERNRTFLPGFLDLKTASNQRVVFGIGETTWATTEIENKYPFICESGKDRI